MDRNIFNLNDFIDVQSQLFARQKTLQPRSYPENHLKLHFNAPYDRIRRMPLYMDSSHPEYLKRFNYEIAEIRYSVRNTFYSHGHFDETLDFATPVRIRMAVLKDTIATLSMAGRVRENEIRPLLRKQNRSADQEKFISDFLESMEKFERHIRFLNETFWHMDDRQLTRFCNLGLYAENNVSRLFSLQSYRALDARAHKAPPNSFPYGGFAYYW